MAAATSAGGGAAAPAGKPLVVAIDGPAASGKGTLAKGIAAALGLAHMDTGLLYRRVGAAALTAGVPLDDEPALARLAAALPPLKPGDEAALRSEAAGQAASRVSALPAVRAALLGAQRAFAERPPPPAKGAVLDGRDIGTVVCPNATAKLFVIASPEVRARRRLLELQERFEAAPTAAAGAPSQGAAADAGAPSAGAGPAPGPAKLPPPPPPPFEEVLAQVKERDARDESRAAAPLVAAPDALTLDTSGLGPGAALEAALAFIREREAVAAGSGGGGGGGGGAS